MGLMRACWTNRAVDACDKTTSAGCEGCAKYPGPTPETARKRRGDTLLTLHRRGSITDEHLWAGMEIRGAVEAVGRGMMPIKPIPYPTVDGSRFCPGIEGLSESVYRAWKKYVAWSRRTPNQTRALVVAVVVDNVTIDNAALSWGCRKERIKERLAEGLDRYR